MKLRLLTLTLTGLTICNGAQAMDKFSCRDFINRINKRIKAEATLPSKYTEDPIRPNIHLTTAVLSNLRPAQLGFFDRLKKSFGFLRRYSNPLSDKAMAPDYVGTASAELDTARKDINGNNYTHEHYKYCIERNKQNDDVAVYSEINTAGQIPADRFNNLDKKSPKVLMTERLASSRPNNTLDSVNIALLDTFTKCVGIRFNEGFDDYRNGLTSSAEGDTRKRHYWCKTVIPYAQFVQFMNSDKY